MITKTLTKIKLADEWMCKYRLVRVTWGMYVMAMLSLAVLICSPFLFLYVYGQPMVDPEKGR